MSKFTKKLFSLGELYVSDFINKSEDARAGKHDMTLVIDERYGAARLEKCTPIHSMFGKYWYRSGILLQPFYTPSIMYRFSILINYKFFKLLDKRM